MKNIYKGFGGILLEDIGSPHCFEIEERLKAELPIPVMHDDQHGTAVVTLASVISACKQSGVKLGIQLLDKLGSAQLVWRLVECLWHTALKKYAGSIRRLRAQLAEHGGLLLIHWKS